MKQFVYFFSTQHTDTAPEGKEILGGKGDGLAKMTSMGLPVPPGFTLSTEVCQFFHNNKQTYPASLKKEVETALKELESITEKQFGGSENPLLVSVRSGAAQSMPGMMDTVLNLGLNDTTVEAMIKKTNNPRFVYDAYRRFIQMFCNVVESIPEGLFEKRLTHYKKHHNIENDSDISAETLKTICDEFKNIYLEHKKEPFPQDVIVQLWKAIDAVFLSWNNERAINYRRINKIENLLGTAVNICSMVYGNLNDNSGTGVAFTRDPSTGNKELFGEFLPNAQGEDIVAGLRTPYKISELEKRNPTVYNEFLSVCNILETHYKDVQDIEFTIEEGKLYLLQTRSAKRTANASLKIAVDLFNENIITKKEALLLVDPQRISQALLPVIDPAFQSKKQVLATGVKASFGVGIGKAIFDPHKLEKIEDKDDYILICEETSPEYLMAMYKAKGILTARGGATSHAAVVTRAMGKPCIVGCSTLYIHSDKAVLNGHEIYEGDIITLNATEGEIIAGKVPLIVPETGSAEMVQIMDWAKSVKKIGVRVNADTPKECQMALKLGAEGVGLARTEHMFFEKERILFMREMIFAQTKKERLQALSKILPFQQKDFYEIFSIMKEKPVTIRLIDPPLHEFLPKEDQEKKELAKHMNITMDDIHRQETHLYEANPMLGLRGCRLGIVNPEIIETQVKAIIMAACKVKKDLNITPQVEIMVPLTGTLGEMKFMKTLIKRVATEVLESESTQLEYKIGTMIEIPRACIIADQLADEAEFFSFGTNDLTQTTFGFSRDDSHTFIEEYQDLKILPYNPFERFDTEGTGELMKMAIQKGKASRPNIKLGVCGEHGGDPQSIEFFYKAGIEYVSCSTFRLPTAILAAAHASITEEK